MDVQNNGNHKLARLLGGTEARRGAKVQSSKVKVQRGEGGSGGGGGAVCGLGAGGQNNREVLTCGPQVGLVATTDPFDRAHQQRDSVGLGLMPACRVLGRKGGRLLVGQPLPGSRPRLYPRAVMVSGPAGPVSIDSQFDQAYERAVRLSDELGDVAGAGAYVGAGVLQIKARAAGMQAMESRLGRAKTIRLVAATRSAW